MTFIDEFSGYIIVVPIAKKSLVCQEFMSFRPWFEGKFECVTKKLHSDNGGEYEALRGFLREKGI